MQKFLHFELTVALKDRSRSFQLFTLVLFSLAVTIIIVSTVARFASSAETSEPTQAFKTNEATNYATFAAAPASQMLHLKK